MKYIIPENREQFKMLNCLDDMVKKENPVRIIDTLIEQIISSNTEIFYDSTASDVGRPSYSPQTMLKIFIYGYLNGVSSSRRLEDQTKKNIEVIWLLGTLSPDHWTISNYRKENGEQIKFAAKRFGNFLKDNKYIEGKTVAVDGAKVKANASRDMVKYKNLEKKINLANEDIEEYLKRLKENDLVEDLEEEYDQRSGGAEEGINDYLVKKISELQEEIGRLTDHKEHMETEERKTISPTDKDARLMKSRDGMIPAYNVQLVVDEKNKMIIDTEVTKEEYDVKQLSEMVKSLKEETGIVPEEVIADKGYYNPELIEKVEETGINCFIAIPKTQHDKEEVSFTYDSEKNEYICSEGKKLVLKSKNKDKRGRLADEYQGTECLGCSIRGVCTKSKRGRILYRYKNHEYIEKYKMKMKEHLSKTKILLRKTIVEHPIGTIKYLMGKIPLKLRGTKKVTTEINLYRTVYNIKRLINLEDFGYLSGLMLEYNWKSG